MEYTKIVIACGVLVMMVLLIFGDPYRIGKERDPFTASSYALNLVVYLAIAVLCVLVLVDAVN